jgi:hypothetical protein
VSAHCLYQNSFVPLALCLVAQHRYNIRPFSVDQGSSTGVPRNPRVPREIVIEKKTKHRFLNLLAKINRSTEKYHSLHKRALTIVIGLLYLQLTDHANVPWAVDITIFKQGFPETWKLFQGFLQGKKIEKGWCRWCSSDFMRRVVASILRAEILKFYVFFKG